MDIHFADSSNMNAVPSTLACYDQVIKIRVRKVPGQIQEFDLKLTGVGGKIAKWFQKNLIKVIHDNNPGTKRGSRSCV